LEVPWGEAGLVAIVDRARNRSVLRHNFQKRGRFDATQVEKTGTAYLNSTRTDFRVSAPAAPGAIDKVAGNQQRQTKLAIVY
jgi:hypothetical protein